MSRIRRFFSQRTNSFKQFPVAYTVLLYLTIVSIVDVYSDTWGTDTELLKLLLAGIFTLPLVLIPWVLNRIQHREWDEERKWWKASFITQAVLLLAGVGFYFLIAPLNFDIIWTHTQVLIFGSIILAYVLLITMIAWKKMRNEQFTRLWLTEVLLAILIGGLAWLILRGWISASIKSVEYLFNLDFDGKIYWYIWSICMILIWWSIALINFINQPWDEVPRYSRIARIFGQYIFLPLTIIYGVILLSYWVKIFTTGVRPEWGIIYMVIGYVAFGMLTWLTTYPALPNKFIQRSHLLLFFSFVLAALLMVPAIEMRVSEYGLTINRYFIRAIIAWIIGSSALSVIFKKYRFFIRTTLLVVIWWFSLYGGKRSAAQLPVAHQKIMLQKILAENNIQAPLTSWNFNNLTYDQKEEIKGPLRYLLRNTEISNLEGIFSTEDIQRVQAASESRYGIEGLIWKRLQIDIWSYWDEYNNNNQYFSFYTNSIDYNVNIAEYDTMYNINNKGVGSNIIHFWNNTFDLTEYLEEIFNKSSQTSYWKDTESEPYIITTDTVKIILFSIDWNRVEKEDGSVSYTTDYYNGVLFTKWDWTNTSEEENDTITTGDVDTSTGTTTEIRQEIVQPPVETLPVEPIQLPVVTH